MPLHDYKCGACSHQFEELVGINDPHPRKCPECGKLKLKKVLFTRPPVPMMRYSPMHPRQGRGMTRR